MAEAPRNRRSDYRVFADDTGDVYLIHEPTDTRIRVERPVTSETLAEAKRKATQTRTQQEQVEATERLETIDKSQAKAQEEIELALYPLQRGSWLTRLSHASGQVVFHLIAALLYLGVIVGVYKGLQYSSENFPELIHRGIIFLTLCVIAGLLYVISTEENRIRHQEFVLVYFGIYGMFVLPCFLLVTTGAVLASITFRLYNSGSIALDMCSGRAVSEAGLLDFYMWHFINIIPTLELTKLWRWGEPYCFTQSRVGLLIFVFQLFVVIPSFNTIRFFWKHRHLPGYAYDPDWNPSLL